MRETSPLTRSGNCIGIDLGLVNTIVARFNEAGAPEITYNSEGSRITPSVVLFEENGEIIIGTEARKFLSMGHPNVFAEFRSVIGEPGKSCRIDGKEITPTDLSAILLKKVVQDYADQFGQPDSIVISLPANFRNEQREAMKEAADRAGIAGSCFIEEAVAATLFHSTLHALSGKYLVYNFGKSTFDVALVEAKGKEIKIISHKSVEELGDKALDEALNKLVGDKFTTKTGDVFDAVDCNYTKMDKENLRSTLSVRDEVRARLVSTKHGPFIISIARKEFNSAISPLISLAESACESVLKCGHIDPSKYVKASEVIDVFMIGEGSRTPAIQESMYRLFGKAPKVIEPEAAVALGAAVYSAMISRGHGRPISILQLKGLE